MAGYRVVEVVDIRFEFSDGAISPKWEMNKEIRPVINLYPEWWGRNRDIVVPEGLRINALQTREDKA